MKKKIALNTFYTLCIFLCLVAAYVGITDNHYEYLVAAVVIGTIFVMLKIKLLKEVRNTLKP